MSQIPVRDWLNSVLADAIRDTPDENVWQYAAEHIYLDGHQSLVARYFDPHLTPYTKIFQEAATGQFDTVAREDWWFRNLMEKGARVDEFFALKSSQSGFTQAALNIIAYITRFLTGRGIYCIDSRDKAGKLCKLRLIPILQRLCSAQISDNEDDLGTYWIEMANWVWEMVGSYSAGVFSEKPLTHAFLDDVEYMVTEGGKRGMLDGVHIIDHARSRFTTADAHFLAVFSKPDDEESQFIAEHRGGSQHEWHVPCPQCNHPQVLELDALHFDKDICKDLTGTFDLEAVEALTTTRCVACRHDIEERWKPAMNEAGFYLPKSMDARRRDGDPLLVPRRLSVRVNDMVSPFAEVSWGKLAVKKIGARDNPAKLKFLVTNHGAKPWRERALNLKADHIHALVAGAKHPITGEIHGTRCDVQPYRRGEIPFVPAAFTLTVDVQGDRKKWLLGAWKADGTLAVVEYGQSLSLDDMLDIAREPKSHAGLPIICLADPELVIQVGHGLPSGGALIDSGYDTITIYKFCAATGWQFYPSKGVPRLDIGGNMFEAKTDFIDGQQILRYQYHDYSITTHLMKWKIGAHTQPDAKLRKPSDLHLPEDVTDEFVAEFLSMSLQPDRRAKTAVPRMIWFHDKTIAPNDWPDCLKMQYVIWQIIGPAIRAAALQK